MTEQLAVSVALCTYNGAAYVGEQLRSILSQDRPPAEVVVSDDGSTDGTPALVEAVWASLDSATAPRLVLLRNEQALGVSANFEQATAACTSPLIALSDQDDVWEPGRLAVMAGEFDARPGLTLLFTDATLIDSAGATLGASLFDALEVGPALLGAVRDGRAFDSLLRRNIVTGATVVFRRELLRVAAPFDRSWVHDEWLAILAAATGTIDWLPQRLIGYRQHGANQIGVAVPSLRYKIGRVFESRGDRYTNLVERATALAARLEEIGAAPDLLAAVGQKLEHQRRRAALPRFRPARIAGVLREARTGRYTAFSSQGGLDIVRDLLSRP